MPWKSLQQAKWGHSSAGEEALGGPEAVSEWDAATTAKLPTKAPPKPRLPHATPGLPSKGGKGNKRGR